MDLICGMDKQTLLIKSNSKQTNQQTERDKLQSSYASKNNAQTSLSRILVKVIVG